MSVLRGHSVLSSPPLRPMTSDFEGFSTPDFIHYIFFPIFFPYLNSKERASISLLMLSAKQGNYWYHFYYVLVGGLNPGPPALFFLHSLKIYILNSCWFLFDYVTSSCIIVTQSIFKMQDYRFWWFETFDLGSLLCLVNFIMLWLIQREIKSRGEGYLRVLSTSWFNST